MYIVIIVYLQFSQIEGVIENFYGTKPKIQCVHPKVRNKHETIHWLLIPHAYLVFLCQQNADIQVLGQIEICFNPDFTLLDCERQETIETLKKGELNQLLSEFSVCDHDVPVYYPPLS